MSVRRARSPAPPHPRFYALTPRTLRRWYGACDEVNLTEVGMHVCLGELGPDLSGRFRRTITLDAKQQPGLLGRLAYRAEGKGAGKIRTRFGHAFLQLF